MVPIREKLTQVASTAPARVLTATAALRGGEEGDVALSQQSLSETRHRLEAELDELTKELSEYGATPGGGSIEVSLDEGFADAAQATSERAKVLSFVEGLQQRLTDVRAALGRVDRGGYGTCDRCGGDISPERLEAVPTARLCIHCAQKR
ncbi:MAG: TraR/DksA family transcriptional regulator [Actinomycetota bacterium]